MQPPLVHDFGYLGVGDHVAAVLSGTYDIPVATDRYAAQLLPFLSKNPLAVKEGIHPTWLAPDTWQSHWKGYKERTSSGRFMHLGVFKAGSRSMYISELDAAMTNIPMISGYSPLRWRQGTNAMLAQEGRGF